VQQADNGNTERAKIVSRLFEEDALTEDAIRISEIRADTARYTLASDMRAFGVRIVYQGSSRANPYSRETLSLYLPQGQKLARVLDELEMNQERGEWDTNCTGTFETIRSALSVTRTTSSGLADLMVRRTRSGTRNLLQGEECLTQERPSTFSSITLHYDGAMYRQPKRPKRD